VRWRALGQQLLRRGAIWVRDRADRVLSGLPARDGSSGEDSDREALSEASNGPETAESDRPTTLPRARDVIPEAWRARVATAPPRHWLERVQAARRRFTAVWIDAVARPKIPSRSHPADEDLPSPEPPPHRAASYEGPMFEPAAGRPDRAPGDEPSADLRLRTIAPADRDSAGRPTRPGPVKPGPFADAPSGPTRPTRSAPPAEASAQRPDGEKPSAPPVQPDRVIAVHNRPSLPPEEPFTWRAPPRADGVQPHHRRETPEGGRKENASAPVSVPKVRPPRPDPSVMSGASDPVLRHRDLHTRSRESDDLDWAHLAVPLRMPAADRPWPELPEPVRSRAGAQDERSFPESDRTWPAFLPPDPWRRSMAPAPESPVVAAAPSSAASEEAFFFTSEPAGRWPALPDAPSEDDEDWPAMKRRLERLDRLDREQRGW
jgi:hypothetical protein